MIFDLGNNYSVNVEDIATGTDSLVDETLYLSKEYKDVSLDDVYNMLVSVRNCLLLLIIIIFLFESHKVLKAAFKRHYKIGR